MLTSLFQFASLAVIAGVALAVFVEFVRLCGQVLRDRRADRLRIQKLVREIESIQSQRAPTNSVANQARPTALAEISISPRAGGERSSPPARPPAWQGTRAFRIVQKTMECDGCASIYLMPVDGQPLPLFLPGQFLTLTLKIPGTSKPTVRCYSLSDAPNAEYYRCTIKKIAIDPARPESQPGLASTYIHDHVKPGDVVDVAAPRGSFFLDVFSDLPIVLIAAGIGITPLLSMLNTLIQTGLKNRIFLFFGVRSGIQHPFRKHLAKLATQHAHLSISTAYSQPLPQDNWGSDYQLCGRLDAEFIKQTVQTTEARFYVCGPNTFMQSMVADLVAWGIPEESIRFEAFGPSTVRGLRTANRKVPLLAGGGDRTDPPIVEFARSNKTIPWNDEAESLLDLAERNGIEIESGCRAGNCGTCTTFVKSGSVDYRDHADPACEAGHCLPCICTPAESLVLDA